MKLFKLLKNLGLFLLALPFSFVFGVSLSMEILTFIHKHIISVTDGHYPNLLGLSILICIPLILQIGIMKIYWIK